jgi:hypothetical protein
MLKQKTFSVFSVFFLVGALVRICVDGHPSHKNI